MLSHTVAAIQFFNVTAAASVSIDEEYRVAENRVVSMLHLIYHIISQSVIASAKIQRVHIVVA